MAGRFKLTRYRDVGRACPRIAAVRIAPSGELALAVAAGGPRWGEDRDGGRAMSIGLRGKVAALCVGASAAIVVVAPGGSATASTSGQSSTEQLGISTFVPYNCESAAVWSLWASRQFRAFKKLGANSVALAFPMYMDSLTSDSFYAKDVCGSSYQTPPTSELTPLIDIAHADGLQVFLRPLLYETNFEAEGAWRGVIDPTDPSVWFANYWDAMKPYLVMAQADHVEHFAIATELQSMAPLSGWKSIIAQARRIYTGDLVFTTTWLPKENAGVHWPGTSVGFDLYWGLQGLPDTATANQIVAGWDNALATDNPFPLISVATISEIGILPQDGAYSQPYQWTLPLKTNPFNQSIQATWFTAACSFFKSHDMGGIYYLGSTIYDKN